MENQQKQLCGKHALNHLLQEEKIVWVPNKSTLLTEGGKTPDIKDKDTKYNLWNLCQEREKNEIDRLLEKYIEEESQRRILVVTSEEPKETDATYTELIDDGNGGLTPRGTSNLQNDINEWKKNQAQYGNNKDPDTIKEDVEKEVENNSDLKQKYTEQIKGSQGTCDSGGNVPFQWFTDVFEELGYRHVDVGKNDYQTKLEGAMNDPNYLGFFINQGTWHYVSSPKYSNFENNCEFVIADSLGPKYTCYKTKEEYFKALPTLPVERGYLIFADDANAYQSVAVERMKKASAAEGKVVEKEAEGKVVEKEAEGKDSEGKDSEGKVVEGKVVEKEAEGKVVEKEAVTGKEAEEKEFLKGGKSLKAQRKKNKKTKRKYYVYNK